MPYTEHKTTRKRQLQAHYRQVAKLLCQNLPVEAEKFETVSCLFSDIVGFTNMCGSCAPMDIVRLLNKLYLQFDNLSNIHGVYKVETIGDAYVVVAGVPDFVEDHADRLVAMGLDMITATKSVANPVNGEPIQMRIGVHTGNATAGVVGLTMPRYCLFGNTVTLANKTESLSKPSRVNVTEVSRRHLTKQDYVFEDNLDVGDFPLKCYLVDMAAQPFAAARPAAAVQQPADDSLLLSPSSSPVRRSSSVPSPTFEADEIGIFIKNRLTSNEADAAPPTTQEETNGGEPLFETRTQASSGGPVPSGRTDERLAVIVDSAAAAPPPTNVAANTTSAEDASSDCPANSTDSQEHCPFKAAGKTSFLGLRWKVSQSSNKTRKAKSDWPHSQQDDHDEYSGGSVRFLESPEPKAGKLQCPFFRFRGKNAGIDDGLAQDKRGQECAASSGLGRRGRRGRCGPTRHHAFPESRRAKEGQVLVARHLSLLKTRAAPPRVAVRCPPSEKKKKRDHKASPATLASASPDEHGLSAAKVHTDSRKGPTLILGFLLEPQHRRFFPRFRLLHAGTTTHEHRRFQTRTQAGACVALLFLCFALPCFVHLDLSTTRTKFRHLKACQRMCFRQPSSLILQLGPK
ncbi:hypothetical protein HPB48_004935 [Haemaphysalis longicornis]|uniref:Guanylate cyclase domain-containing protein n=1 Tax=Haemaphysalis longicornis TaxID=44386 RepID=A0A9J6G458_HAELO|nr:hypothetical protein HPB48_004935 [Haemaphysalis longicornis]